MPTSPAANPSEKALVNQLKNLAQADANNTAIQIGVLNEEITKYQHGKTLFETRYNYWDGYLGGYNAERRLLDGQYSTSPILQADFDAFLNQQGRLFDINLAVPARLAPVRIAEFDSLGTTSYDAAGDESIHIANEAIGRAELLSSFNSSTFPTGFVTGTPLTTASTTVEIERTNSATIPTGVKILIRGVSTAAIVMVTGSTLTHTGTGPSDPYVYTLNITVLTPSFSTIASNATVLNSFTAFTNAERTAKTPTEPRYQDIMDGMIERYKDFLLPWKDLLQLQRNAILAETSEDDPDEVYVEAQLNALNKLIMYLPGMDVSDTGLTSIQSLATERTAAIPARIAYFSTRGWGVGAFDERYKYANLLYNLSDGAVTNIKILTQQRDSLVASQGASNARAAKFAAEAF